MYEGITVKDLEMIFGKSLVMFNKEPHYVMGIPDPDTLTIKCVSSGKVIDTLVSNKLFDFKPVKLGMCNEGREAYYVSRKPIRQFKQGLTEESINIIPLSPNARSESSRLISKFVSKGLVACIKNEYPSHEECFKKIENDEVDSIAFSKVFAINKDYEVFYKNDIVGVIDPNTKELHLKKSKMFLKRIL